MKKETFFKAAAAICLSFALLPFAGCAQMPDAKTLMEKADEEMKSLIPMHQPSTLLWIWDLNQAAKKWK